MATPPSNEQKPEKKQKKSVKTQKQEAPGIDQKDQLLHDYTNTLKRLQADFENYIKRAEKERTQYQQYGAAKILTKILPIIDDFERATTLIQKTPDTELKQGLTMIHQNFTKILHDEGVQPILTLGQHFDPYKHEIIDTVDSDKDDGMILAEIQKGYTYNDTVLRASKVRVAKPKQPPQPQEVHDHV